MAGTAGATGGMLSGIVSGVIWGAVVGGLVLMLAALVLDLDRGRGGAGGADPDAEESGVAVVPDGIGPAPVLLQRLDLFGPPNRTADRPRALPDPQRSLVPRPAQPVLPRLVAGGAVPVPDSDVPRVPPAPVGMARMTQPDIPGMPGDVSVPTAIPPLSAPTVGAVPARPLAAAPGMPAPPPLVSPSPLIAAPSPPRIGAAPGIVPPTVVQPRPTDARPARDAVAPPGDVTAPGQPPAPPASGPQVAFILDGATDAPMPDWLRARAMPGDGAAPQLEHGGAVFMGGDGVAGYLAARANGMPALLAYARLDAADDILLDRVAAHARRDGAVAMLVAPDPALWDRIGVWLNGPARDLVPVDAGRLLE